MPSPFGLYLGFNPQPAETFYLDINSCFAAIEQQANPALRGKPVVVTAYPTANGCILAASVEAKKFGIKTGMRVKDGRLFCPNLVVLPADPSKYRRVHLRLKQLLTDFSPNVVAKSIDEFTFKPFCPSGDFWTKAGEIKQRIKKEIGEAITVSIGMAPNRYLAKVASNLKKPDSLEKIDKENFKSVYQRLELRDLVGIKTGSTVRLNLAGITTVWDFYQASAWQLKAAFSSVTGLYWRLRLHGYEIDNFMARRGSFGNSYALPSGREEPLPILAKLVAKTGVRLRQAGYGAKGAHLAIWYRDGTFWHHGVGVSETLFDSRDIFKKAAVLLRFACPAKPVREIAVSVFNLVPGNFLQLEMFADAQRKSKLTTSIDKINGRWGAFTLIPARMLKTKNLVIDRIGFGSCPQS